MDDNNSKKKQKLEQGLTETNFEGGIDEGVGTSGNVAAVNENFD